MFEKISKPVRIYQEVAEQIEDAIVSGELKTGEKLPSEREMAKVFGISQRTVREALRILEEKGLIETIQTGNVVKPLTTDVISKNLDLLIRLKKISWEDMFQFRLELDSMVTARAAEAADDEDAAVIEAIIENLMHKKNTNELDWDTFQSIDREFHLAISRIAKNPMYEWILMTMIDFFVRYYEQFRVSEEKYISENLSTYDDFLQALKTNDTDAARNAAEEHIRVATNNLGEMRSEAIQAIIETRTKNRTEANSAKNP